MTDLSLKYYLKLHGANSVRGCLASGIRSKKLSLKSLETAPRIIHISDLHFTDSEHTWDVGGSLGIRRDDPDNAGRQALGDFLINNHQKFGADTVVITGDITDSGGDKDYPIARDFINKLETAAAPFQVYAVPGNHDYCWEGNLFFEDLFATVKGINTAGEIGALVAAFTVPDPSGATLALAITTAKASIFLAIKAAIRAQLSLIPGGMLIPEGLVDALAALFIVSIDVSIAGVNIIISMTDTVNNETRRQRYIQYIPDHYPGKYPRFIDSGNMRLILLDSIQDKLDHKDGDITQRLAQGRLGEYQLNKFAELVSGFQDQRRQGKKLAVCLHHSPFHMKEDQKPNNHFSGDGTGGLEDFDKFLAIASSDKVDCLLFGHTTPGNVFNQPRPDSSTGSYVAEDADFQYYEENFVPLINCENLEQVPKGSSYPVTVLDLGSYQRTVFRTGTSDPPVRSWGHPTHT